MGRFLDNTLTSAPVIYEIRGYRDLAQQTTGETNRAYSVRCIRDNGAILSYTLPSVTTDPVTNATATAMTCSGTIVSNGGAAITSRGFCYGTDVNPDTSNTVVTVSTSNNNFQKYITGLDLVHNIYHVRAFAVNAAGISYGEDVVVDLSTHNVYYETSCDTYSWHNQTYSQSGTYVYTYANAIGCASADTLHLTVNYGTHNVESQTAVNEYTWHAQTYSQSGTYTYAYNNASGCPSVDTLHLTIYSSSTNSIHESAFDFFHYRGQEFSTSGTYIIPYTVVEDSATDVIGPINQSNTTYLTPFCNYNNYSWNESIYTGSEVGNSG